MATQAARDRGGCSRGVRCGTDPAQRPARIDESGRSARRRLWLLRPRPCQSACRPANLRGPLGPTTCRADQSHPRQELTNRRNGSREARDWDTRAGTVELAIPRLRAASYFAGLAAGAAAGEAGAFALVTAQQLGRITV